MSKTIKLLLISVALLSSLHAKQTIELQPLTITSTAIETDELKSTDAVEVYTQEDIEKAHVQNVYEFLNQQTSVTSMPSYGNPFSQKLDMRGYGIGDGYQNIIITVNGRKINNIDMVAPLLSSISPSSISKIEIIKSSGIVMGGDGANAGVINITTKKNNDKEVSFYMGNYGTVDGSFYVGHKDDKLAISVTGESQKSDGIRDIDSNGNRDENTQTTGSFYLAYTPIEELELRAGASISRTDVIYAGSLTEEQYKDNPSQQSSKYYSSVHQLYDTNVLNAGISYYINDSLSINLDANHEQKDSTYITYGTASDYTYNSAKATIDYEADKIVILAGIDIFDGTRKSHKSAWAIANDMDKQNLAGFIMGKYSFGNNSLKAGYRYEQVTYEFNDATTSNKDDHTLNGIELGYNYTFDKEKSIFLNYSHSYQAPDIDRFFSNGVFNDFIDPMEADNFTLGFNYIQANNKLKVSIFYIDLKDEIYYYSDLVTSPPTPSLSVNTNIDKSHKYGLDLYNKYLINNEFNIVFNYNYIQAIIDEEIGRNGEDYSGNKLPGVSNHNAKATLSYLPNQQTTIALTQVYRSEAYAANDFNNNFSQKQDAYNSTDISATYAKDNWEIFAKINNLFNQSNGLWIKNDAIYPVNFTTTAIAGFKLKY